MRSRVRVVVLVWVSALAIVIGIGDRVETQGGTEAPTGFELVSNGFAEEFCANQRALTDSPNSPEIPDDECNFDAALEEFTGPETVADGLGPIFNAAGCGECHATPIIGGFSQVVEKRAGRFDGSTFFEHPGGSLIQDRALDASIQERVLDGHNVTAFRATISVLGDGFVEAIGNTTLDNIRLAQPSSVRGQLINVPVLEKPGTTRAGRFGWKDQHASLVSFSADAYKNEMGITSPLDLVEPTSNGDSVAAFDPIIPEPDDAGVDVELFALFQRATKAPPRDPVRSTQPDAVAGSNIFSNIGCAQCHTRNITTQAPGTLINGGALRVTNALGNKVIHPFSDFLLHDIGTGDGIVQNGPASTRNKVRTSALWGLRARGRFMHDGLSLTLNDAIQRHRNQASAARTNFNNLSTNDKNRVFAFLLSL